MMFIMMGALSYMLFLVIRAATARNDTTVGADTEVIPAKATFAGIRGIPWLAIATNNASPWFVMAPSGIEYRVIRKHKRAYADITQVDVRTAPGTVNIEIQFRDELLTLAVNVGTNKTAKTALAHFPSSTIFTPRALAVLHSFSYE